ADTFVADFIGEANLFEAEVVSVSGNMAAVRLGKLEMTLPARGRSPGPAMLAVRPGRIRIGAPGAPRTLDGTLSKVTYVGSHLEFVVDTEFGEVFAVSSDVDAPFVAGQKVGMGFAEHGPVLVSHGTGSSPAPA
ncbi:MAG: potA 2, partial [Rhizobiaceae bacterium]|nr:potA 2 [Rhizobiaceae bacterium]